MSRPNRWQQYQSHQYQEKLEQNKAKLCQSIRRSMARKRLNQSQLANYLGTSRACVCQVQRQQTEKLTFNQLFRYLVALEPYFEILISI